MYAAAVLLGDASSVHTTPLGEEKESLVWSPLILSYASLCFADFNLHPFAVKNYVTLSVTAFLSSVRPTGFLNLGVVLDTSQLCKSAV